jgi:hypothetical protein
MIFVATKSGKTKKIFPSIDAVVGSGINNPDLKITKFILQFYTVTGKRET